MLYAWGTLCSWTMVSKEALTIVSPTSSPNQVFARFVYCFTINTLSICFCSDLTDYCKNMHFKGKTIFFSIHGWSVWILLYCVYVFLRALFHSSCLHTCIASYLSSHQIMWHKKRIHSHGLKTTSCCCFFIFRGN